MDHKSQRVALEMFALLKANNNTVDDCFITNCMLDQSWHLSRKCTVHSYDKNVFLCTIEKKKFIDSIILPSLCHHIPFTFSFKICVYFMDLCIDLETKYKFTFGPESI